ncbi:hypothetical protein BG011_001706, partial [Mortierella polycephala]
KRLFAKSQSAPGAENTSHLHQTRLNLQPINKQRPTSQPQQRPEDEDAVSEQDLELVKSLEDALDRVKESVENLQRQVNKETHNLETMRRVFQEEEDDVAMKIRIVESEIQDLECTIEDQEADIKKKGEHILQLGIETESKEVEIAKLQEQLEEFEEETMRLLSGGDLLDLNEDINELDAVVDREMETMVEMKAKIDKVEEQNEKLLHEEASCDECLRDNEILIKEYEAELELTGTDLQMSKAHAIEVEFDALKRQYMVAKGSAVDREITEYQTRLKFQYEQEYMFLRRQRALATEIIDTRNKSHDEKLFKYRNGIKGAEAAIVCARADSRLALTERQQVEARAQAVRSEIEQHKRK